jgi:hypothetical protein
MTLMRPVAFGEALSSGTRLTLFSDDKPDRFFTVIKFWMDATSGVALALRGGIPTYQVEDEESMISFLGCHKEVTPFLFADPEGNPLVCDIEVSPVSRYLVNETARSPAALVGERQSISLS